MSVRRGEWGWGTLGTSVTLILAFRTEKSFELFRGGQWSADAGAAAVASFEGQGIDVGLDMSALEGDVVAVELAETGAGVALTVRALRFSRR